MKSQATNDELRDFHRFLGAVLKNGSARLSPEQALEEVMAEIMASLNLRKPS